MFTGGGRNSRLKLRMYGDDATCIAWREFYETKLQTLLYYFMASYLILRMHSSDYWDLGEQLVSPQPMPL